MLLARFYGGPWHNQDKKLPRPWPPEVRVAERDADDLFTAEQAAAASPTRIKRKVALYRHTGAGVYEYTGSW